MKATNLRWVLAERMTCCKCNSGQTTVNAFAFERLKPSGFQPSHNLNAISTKSCWIRAKAELS